jgi:hypothetical protein
MRKEKGCKYVSKGEDTNNCPKRSSLLGHRVQQKSSCSDICLYYLETGFYADN